jgi:hypothetical protein
MADTKTCGHCKTQIHPDAKRCPNCGQRPRRWPLPIALAFWAVVVIVMMYLVAAVLF